MENENEDKIFWVNAYSVTRHYGGPEEGGWWYNWYESLASVPVQGETAAQTEKERLENLFGSGHGDIYSVLGGEKIFVYIEDEACKSESKVTPHYE